MQYKEYSKPPWDTDEFMQPFDPEDELLQFGNLLSFFIRNILSLKTVAFLLKEVGSFFGRKELTFGSK